MKSKAFGPKCLENCWPNAIKSYPITDTGGNPGRCSYNLPQFTDRVVLYLTGLSKIITGPDSALNAGQLGSPPWFGSPSRAKLIQASLTFPPSSRSSRELSEFYRWSRCSIRALLRRLWICGIRGKAPVS